jgi:hypothetical protein
MHGRDKRAMRSLAAIGGLSSCPDHLLSTYVAARPGAIDRVPTKARSSNILAMKFIGRG